MKGSLDRMDPADLSLTTLKHYWYDGMTMVLNWVFPIDTSEFELTRGPKRRIRDSRPVVDFESVSGSA